MKVAITRMLTVPLYIDQKFRTTKLHEAQGKAHHTETSIETKPYYKRLWRHQDSKVG